MSYKTYNFTNATAMDLFLNGGVSGGRKVVSANDKGRILGLHNKTLIINGSTCTFSDAAGTGLTLAQIKTAIQAAAAGVTAAFIDGSLTLEAATAITVAKTGTANSVFGFSSNEDTVGTVFNPYDGVAPRVLFIGASPTQDSYAVTTELA
jgi:hypothetical protein